MRVGGRAHLELMRGTIQQAAEYCRKDFSNAVPNTIFFEHGEMVRAGQRTDINTALTECATVAEMMDRYPELYCRFRNGLLDIFAARASDPVKPELQTLWFYGPTGTGKSREAHAILDAAPSRWVAPLNLDWFDGYHGQEAVLFDDFRKSTLGTKYGFTGLLRLLDRYPVTVNIRNHQPEPWIPKLIIITCNVGPRDCYSWHDNAGETHDREDIAQLLRRITEVRRFGDLTGTAMPQRVTGTEVPVYVCAGGHTETE